MKLLIDIDKELKSAVYNCGLFLMPTDKMSLIDAINNGTPLEDYCLTQCETANPCVYCKHEFENKIIDKHIGDKCTADDCDLIPLFCDENIDCCDDF